MIGWIVIGSIVLLFVLLFTVHAYITIEAGDELALTVRILGIPIRILPKKPKKYKISDYTLKKIRKRDAPEAKTTAKKAVKMYIFRTLPSCLSLNHSALIRLLISDTCLYSDSRHYNCRKEGNAK